MLFSPILAQEVPILESTSIVESCSVMEVRNRACDLLLNMRVSSKVKGSKFEGILNRINISEPISRCDGRDRPPVNAEDVVTPVLMQEEHILERVLEEQGGGPGVYSVNLKKNYLLDDPDWNQDIVPEFYNGKNILDFVDPEIEQKLLKIDEEEEKRGESGFYSNYYLTEEEERLRDMRKRIYDEKKLMLAYRTARLERDGSMKKSEKVASKVISKRRTIMNGKLSCKVGDKDYESGGKSKLLDVIRKNRDNRMADTRLRGFSSLESMNRVQGIVDRERRRDGIKLNQNESDRRVYNWKPKHLFAGKRKSGKTQRR